MGSRCGNIAHRTVEGVLTYLNAFLILDLSRNLFHDRPELAVLTIVIITIILYFYITWRCNDHGTEIPYLMSPEPTGKPAMRMTKPRLYR